MRTLKGRCSRNIKESATTLIEILAVLVVIAVLAFVLFPELWRPRRGGHPISCVNNLKNVGLACRTFAVDYDGRYPWVVGGGGTNGGIDLPSENQAAQPTNNVFFAFATLSNELSTPKILLCPNDNRKMATNTWQWGLSQLGNAAKIPSYFLGTSATEEQPQSILGGDRNLIIGTAGLTFNKAGAANYNKVLGIKASDVLPKTAANTNGWSSDIHNHGGNILLGDGSVQQESDGRARDQLRDTANALGATGTNVAFDLFFPAF